MAGSSSDFDSVAFEAGIRAAMEMGLPITTADVPMFYFHATTTVAGGAPVDGEGVPFSPSATITSTAPPPVAVDCAIESGTGSDEFLRAGTLDTNHLKLTFLEVDYQKIKGFAYVVVGGEKYDYRSTDAPMGLFNSGIRSVHVQSEGGV